MPVVLYYHSISTGPLSVSPDEFRGQLKRIKDAKMRGVSISEFMSANEERRKCLVGLTFDDCFLDVFENALPIIKEYGYSATLFAVPGWDNVTRWGNIQSRRWAAKEGGGYEIPYKFMGPKERREAVRTGMEIGCHTMTHPNLDEIETGIQSKEIIGAKNFLEDELGVPVSSFAYPRGRYDKETIKIVSEAGFTVACTTQADNFWANTSRYKVPRFGVGGDLEIFDSVLCGKYGKLSIWRRLIRKIKRTL